MQCPGCGAAMRLDDDKDFFTCEYCGNVYFPEPDEAGVRVLGEPLAESCPVCAVPLVHAALLGHRFRYCQHCRGTLIGVEEFVVTIEDLRANLAPAAELAHPLSARELDRHIRCPQCHEEMDTHPYGGGGNVVIDICETCQLNWLDYGELRRIVRVEERVFVGE